MKSAILAIALFLGVSVFAQTPFYTFKVNDIDGKPYDLSQLKGKKVMVVNVASKCGLTPQYEQLEALYRQYASKGFVIIGFPANNFLKQEPGSNEEIKTFCTTKFNVTFPMMSKISVKGDNIHPLYQWLTQKSRNGVVDAEVSWNFQKFLIDEQGHLVGFVAPKEKPDSKSISTWIETGKFEK